MSKTRMNWNIDIKSKVRFSFYCTHFVEEASKLIFTLYPSSANARRLKSWHPFVPAAHLISSSETKCVRHSRRITNGMWSWRTIPYASAFSSPTLAPPPDWPSKEEPGSGLTASAPVLDVSAPVCTNGVWPHLWPVSVAQKNKPSTMLSYNVYYSIDFPMDCMAWRFWMMRQPNGCSTPAPRSSAAKQWFVQLAQKKFTF